MSSAARWILPLAACLAASLFSPAVFAQTGEQYALLVGIREYDKNELRSLAFSEADVEGVARMFRDAGYRPENVVVMTQTLGAKQNRLLPTAANIRREIQLLLTNRTEADRIVIALAGHGVQFRGEEEAFFCPSDAKLTDKATLISIREIYEALNESKAGLKLLLADCCRNDPQSDNSRSRPEVSLESVTRPKIQTPPTGVAALFSCSAGERAYEHAELKHGVFFHFVIQGLRGDADLDRDRTVTLPELQQYTLKRVPDFVRAEYGVVQTPDLLGKTRGLFPILKIDAAATNLPFTKLRVTGQSISSRQVVQKFIEDLEARHYSRHKLDDEIASRWIDKLLAAFDSQHVYFLQSDVDRFRADLPSLAGKARLGDVGFVWNVFHVWVDRRVQRLRRVDELLETTHDFSVLEDARTKPPEAWPRTEDEATDAWRRSIKATILANRARGYDLAEATHQAARFYHVRAFGNLQSYDDDSLLEIALTALGNAFDPQSAYLSPRSTETLASTTRQQLVGIGVSLNKDDDALVVQKVIAKGPAALDGRLKTDDRIMGIAEGAGDFKPVAELTLNEAVDLIRGKEGTTVRLQVLSPKRTSPAVYEIPRGKVALAAARGTVFDEPRRDGTRPVKIGYITLPSLYGDHTFDGKAQVDASVRSSTSDVARLLSDFVRQDADIAILDLRFNSGGLLKETSNLLSLFLDAGPAYQTRGRDGTVQVTRTTPNQIVWDRPLIVLTSKMTNSGAEMIAGALQDHRRALVIGDTHTGGTGTVQNIDDIGKLLVKGSTPPKLGAMKITTNLFFLPLGRTTEQRGIVPDIVLPSLAEFGRADREKLLWEVDNVPAATIASSCGVMPALIEELKTFSAQRRQFSPEFQEYARNAERFRNQTQRTSVSLEESAYLADFHSQLRPDLTGEPADGSAVTRDAYLNEILAVALDMAPKGRWNEHYAGGMKELRASDFAAAVKSFTAAIADDKRHHQAHYRRAQAHAGAGEWTEALADLNDAGTPGIPVRAKGAVKLMVGEKVLREDKAGARYMAEQLNGDWLWVQPLATPETHAWAPKASIVPLLPDALATKP